MDEVCCRQLACAERASLVTIRKESRPSPHHPPLRGAPPEQVAGRNRGTKEGWLFMDWLVELANGGISGRISGLSRFPSRIPSRITGSHRTPCHSGCACV